MLFGVGNYVQQFAYDALQGGALSVAELASGEPAILLPTLGDWCRTFLDWQILLVGSLAAAIGLCGSSPRHIALFTGLSFAAAITVSDAGNHLYLGDFSANTIFKDFLANLVGGAMAAILATAALWLYEAIIVRFGSGLGYRFIAAASMPLLAVLLTVSVYYLIDFFYQPAVAPFSFTARAPFDGYVSPRNHDNDSKDQADFTFIPTKAMKTDTSITATSGRLAATWKPLLPEQRFKMQLFLVSDCMDLKAAKSAIPRGAVPLKDENPLEAVGLRTDEGMGFLDISKNDNESLSIKMQRPTFYWIQKEKGEPGSAISYFLVRSDVVKRDVRGTTEFLIRLPLLKEDDRSSTPASRTISVSLAGHAEKLTFVADQKLDPRRKVECHFIPSDLAQSSHVPASASALEPGVFVRIDPVEMPLTVYQMFDSELRITGLDGPLETGTIPNGSLKNHDFGKSDLIAVTGNISDLNVDGTDVTTKAGDQIYVMGEIGGSFGDAGEAKFNGVAKVLWKNGHRVNKSRWEKLSTEWQLAILAWFGSLALALYRLLRPALGRLRTNTAFRLD